MCEYPYCKKREEKYKGSNFCIFHCDKENFTKEEIKEFERKFWTYVKEQEDDEKIEVLNFIGFKFPKEFLFIKRKFKKEANFFEAKFNGDVYFFEAKFNGGADFSNAKFNGKASFVHAKFSRYANFEEVTFSGDADFRKATFSGDAIFEIATFNGDASFEMATFTGIADFEFATFNSPVSFQKTTFNGDADFVATTFNKHANFGVGVISIPKNENSKKTMPSIEADQYLPLPVATTFNKKAIFIKAKFSDNANFEKVTFSEDANFEKVTFNGNGSFVEAIFYNSAKFININPENKDRKTSPPQLNFSHSFFMAPEHVEFSNVDLSKASFLNCIGIEKFRFINEKWNEKEGRKAIFDEIQLENENLKDRKDKYKLIGEVYRKLRLAYQRDLRFAEAGDFYIGEMEMRKKSANRLDRVLIWLYDIFSRYGESVWRPFIWIIGIILFFTLPYYLSLDSVAHNPIESLKTSIQVLLWMSSEKLIETNVGWFVIFEKILGALFIALLVLALRRKFKKE